MIEREGEKIAWREEVRCKRDRDEGESERGERMYRERWRVKESEERDGVMERRRGTDEDRQRKRAPNRRRATVKGKR
jgi:hypothetical protein